VSGRSAVVRGDAGVDILVIRSSLKLEDDFMFDV
jgi:hypothetical protein